MTIQLGIIGFPIGHSLSPVFQQAALDHLKLDAIYSTWEIYQGDLGAFIDGLRSPDIKGINVTVPHKEAVLPLLDHVDEWALQAGAVNTIVNRGGALYGYNTDGMGFIKGLRHNAPFELQNKTVLIIGAGGSARGVVRALANESVGNIIIANRTLSRAQSLSTLSIGLGVPAQAISLDWQELSLASVQSELIVNCTSVGMAHTSEFGLSPLLLQQISPNSVVYDLVYNPVETQLLKEAARAGAAVISGIKMLVYQGAASFELWFDRPAPVDVMLESADKAIQDMAQSLD